MKFVRYKEAIGLGLSPCEALDRYIFNPPKIKQNPTPSAAPPSPPQASAPGHNHRFLGGE